MLYRKILILLLLSKASYTLCYTSEEQNILEKKNSKSNSKNKVAISWNGINYLLVNNIYYFSRLKYIFNGKMVEIHGPRRIIENPYNYTERHIFIPRIEELLYNLFSFSLYLFKKLFFYKIDILGDDIFFYHMTGNYTTNILSFIVGVSAYKISFSENLKLEWNLGIGLSWRRLSFSYTTPYRCAICNPHRKIKIRRTTECINNALSFYFKADHDGECIHYTDIMCEEFHLSNFSILEHLKDPYTWEHLDIIINCSIFNLLLFNIVSMSLNFNFGIREIYQAYKYTKLHNIEYENDEEIEKINLPSFMLRSLFSIRHFSLRISFFIPKGWSKK